MTETTVLSGKKISKDDALVHFLGTVDELNSHLGLVKTLLPDKETRQFLEQIQKNLMKLMSHVYNNKNEEYFFCEDDVSVLEKEIEKLKNKLPELTGFVIPGRNTTEAQIHITRTITRRAERMFIPVSEQLSPNAGIYLNKLSDYLFILLQQI